MHEIYRTFATDLHRDRMREADRRRLASQVRRSDRPTLAGRARAALAGLLGQPAPAPTPTLAVDPSACGT